MGFGIVNIRFRFQRKALEHYRIPYELSYQMINYLRIAHVYDRWKYSEIVSSILFICILVTHSRMYLGLFLKFIAGSVS